MYVICCIPCLNTDINLLLPQGQKSPQWLYQKEVTHSCPAPSAPALYSSSLTGERIRINRMCSCMKTAVITTTALKVNMTSSKDGSHIFLNSCSLVTPRLWSETPRSAMVETTPVTFQIWSQNKYSALNLLFVSIIFFLLLFKNPKINETEEHASYLSNYLFAT